MTSPSHSSDEDFLASLGVSLEDADVTADADTHASITDIYAREYDWAGAILSRMYDDMCDLSRGHCKLSGTYYFWETWAFEYFPYTRPELLHTDLGLGLAPTGWRWYRANLHTVRCKKSLKELRAFFDTCTLEQVVQCRTPVRAYAGLPEKCTPQAVHSSTSMPGNTSALQDFQKGARPRPCRTARPCAYVQDFQIGAPAETTDEDIPAAADVEEDQPPPFPGFTSGAGTSGAGPSYQGTSPLSNDELFARMFSRMDMFDTRLTGMESMITDRFQSLEITQGSIDSRLDTLQSHYQGLATQLQTVIQLLQPHPPPPPEA
ncbi:hypothetical protein JCGZ_24414 [Jatropha curcas]|uniref:Aminotransferase-like plant mobile domain-containing protein n=1 Tax=Jatropha curcas TaxID=180498 RepID=A0A067JQ33_JATCU|nr:hypothetical protein JCGZ_24414 [Jatropha curcas]